MYFLALNINKKWRYPVFYDEKRESPKRPKFLGTITGPVWGISLYWLARAIRITNTQLFGLLSIHGPQSAGKTTTTAKIILRGPGPALRINKLTHRHAPWAQNIVMSDILREIRSSGLLFSDSIFSSLFLSHCIFIYVYIYIFFLMPLVVISFTTL